MNTIHFSHQANPRDIVASRGSYLIAVEAGCYSIVDTKRRIYTPEEPLGKLDPEKLLDEVCAKGFGDRPTTTYQLRPTRGNNLVERVKKMSDGQISKAIDASHPVVVDSDAAYAADALAMRLIHGRHDKREIVNLIRWCLMGCPKP